MRRRSLIFAMEWELVQWQWNVVVEGCMGQSGLQKVPPTPARALRAACTEEGTSTKRTSGTSQHTGNTHNQQAQPQVSSYFI